MFEYEKNIKYLYKALLDFDLNLEGLKVFTEIASGSYQFTSIAALLAGADVVYGISKDSLYGMKNNIVDGVFGIAEKLKVHGRLINVSSKSEKYISDCDIITNSGFVRPINKKIVSYMKPNTVIPLMFESWEFNPNHINLSACKEKGVIVAGVNEHHSLLKLFNTFPYKILKLLFDAGMSVYNNKILLISSGEVGNIIGDFFNKNNIYFDRIIDYNKRYDISFYDAIVVVELYNRDVDIISDNGFISTKELKEINPLVQIIHSYGSINRNDIYRNNLSLYPHNDGNTTGDYLSPEITIRLNVASLKVAEIISRHVLSGITKKEMSKIVLENNLIDSLL